MLLTDARRAARVRDGSLVPLAEQDRTQWDRAAITEGLALIQGALASTPIAYQLQAAIAAVHAEASSTDSTDWPQILGLYDLLARLAPGPMVTLNRIVAVAMVQGPRVALDALGAACADPSLANHHRTDAVRGHLLELEGDHGAARAALERAARRTESLLERRYLLSRAALLSDGVSGPPASGTSES
jgi:predicted RNA polymerase sigma factor